MTERGSREAQLPAYKRLNWREAYRDCALCPRLCHRNRLEGERGFCRMTAELRVARASLHLWEEPWLTGDAGSGTVFFTGCPLTCVYCQNGPISRGEVGEIVSLRELVQIFLKLQALGAANINLVTAVHVIPHLLAAIPLAREAGLSIPFVYNSSGYERVSALRLLDGLIDIYLPDFKYWSGEIARRYSGAADYPVRAKAAVAEMLRQVGPCCFDSNGTMTKGVICRHLLLPGQAAAARSITRYLHRTYGDAIYLSLMSQYTPMETEASRAFPELRRRVRQENYEAWIDDCLAAGVDRAYVQEGESASESFIPDFSHWSLQDFLAGN